MFQSLFLLLFYFSASKAALEPSRTLVGPNFMGMVLGSIY